MSDARKIVLNPEIPERLVLGKDVSQKLPQARYVPLLLADLVEQPAFRLGRRHLECLIEGGAGRHDPQLGVQHHEGFSDRGDDVLGIVA